MDEIRTPRLTLRRPRLEDADALFEVYGDPVAMRYWSTPPHADVGQTRRLVRAMIDALDAEGDEFVIEREGRLVGKAGCWNGPELGYILHPALWGRGLAREALQAVIARAFEVRGLSAVTAEIDPRNERSHRLLTRLGFRETGRAERTWCIDGEWSDSLYMELLRPTAP